MDWFYTNFYRNELKKECNGIGVFLFIASISMVILSFFLSLVVGIVNFNAITDNNVLFLMQSIISILSMFAVSIIYVAITNTSLSKVIALKKKKASVFFPLVIFGCASSFIANYLGSIFTYAVSLFGITTDLDMDYGKMGWLEISLFILSVSIIPALVEEFAFRGIILGKLRKYGDAFAVFISALLFGMMHGNIVQIPFAFMVGLALGFITVKSNSILPAIIVHFFNNFNSVIFTVLSENKVLSEDVMNIIYFAIMIIFIIAGIISVAYLCKDKNYFKLTDSNQTLTFREKVRISFSNLGSILFTVYVLINTIYYVILL